MFWCIVVRIVVLFLSWCNVWSVWHWCMVNWHILAVVSVTTTVVLGDVIRGWSILEIVVRLLVTSVVIVVFFFWSIWIYGEELLWLFCLWLFVVVDDDNF